MLASVASVASKQRSSICLQLGSRYEWTQNLKRMGKLLEGSCNAHTGRLEQLQQLLSKKDSVERQIIKG